MTTNEGQGLVQPEGVDAGSAAATAEEPHRTPVQGVRRNTSEPPRRGGPNATDGAPAALEPGADPAGAPDAVPEAPARCGAESGQDGGSMT